MIRAFMVAWVLMVASVSAQELVVPDPRDPSTAYRKPFTDLEIPHPEDRQRVLFVFQPDCAYSRALHQIITTWGTTLPEGWRLIATPVTTPETLAPAAVFYAARLDAAISGVQFDSDSYWDAVYAAVQDRGTSMADLDAMLAALVESGYARANQVRALLGDRRITGALMTAAAVLEKYPIERVPALVIHGRYLIHADHVGADPREMLIVANGLISQHLEKP